MKKRSAESQTRKTDRTRGIAQLDPVVTCRRNVDRDLFVSGERCTADRRVPEIAPVF